MVFVFRIWVYVSGEREGGVGNFIRCRRFVISNLDIFLILL